MSLLRKWLQKRTPKFIYIQKFFGDRPFALLDVGAGNHSASKTKRLFPQCEYHGIDLDRSYNNDESDFQAMSNFYEMDLTRLEMDSIPDNYFDFIRIAHVIEHLHNGDKVIEHLTPKLKQGGYFYIEYPGKKSLKLPSMEGTLNFYDDKTHVRLYTLQELRELLHQRCEIVRSGTRRNMVLLMATPWKMLAAVLKGKKQQGSTFWDLLGFAEFVVAKKR